MKLLTKTSLNFLSISLFIFLTGTVIMYFIYRSMIDANIENELLNQKGLVIGEMSYKNEVDSAYFRNTREIFVKRVPDNSKDVLMFADTVLLDRTEQTYYPHRSLTFTTTVDNQKYMVIITKSLLKDDAMIIRIAFHMTILFIVLVMSLFFLNRILSRKAWTDFYETIEKLKSFNVAQSSEFKLSESEISEFDALHTELNKMTMRIRKDFLNLKEYTEDASHEIQTPLAIINTKLEMLLQSENLTDDQYKLIGDAYEAANRLSKLNVALILLTRIENRQFAETESVSMATVVSRVLDQLEEMIDTKGITVEVNLTDKLERNMNINLAEILVGNLVRNAVRHNFENGRIVIRSAEGKLFVSNTGNEPDADVSKLFNRFVKSKRQKDSIGLGLSIVKKICEVYNFEVSYNYREELHTFEVIL